MALVRACALTEVAPESALAVEVGRTDVAIVRSGERFYAIADECSHAAIPLSEGDVEKGEIECYLHGSRFDLQTGRPLGLPATEAVPVYLCQVVGNDVFVDLDALPEVPDGPSTAAAHDEASLTSGGTTPSTPATAK